MYLEGGRVGGDVAGGDVARGDGAVEAGVGEPGGEGVKEGPGSMGKSR